MSDDLSNRPTMNEIVQRVSLFLRSKKMRLVTAESCTGGWVAKAMTDLAGSSECFDRAFVTYSNEAKVEMLGVNPNTLDFYGAVSEEVVREMVSGALKRSRAKIALAISGIAGPGGGTATKPVGTVCFAWLKEGGEAITETHLFEGDRRSIRYQSVECVLQGIVTKYS